MEKMKGERGGNGEKEEVKRGKWRKERGKEGEMEKRKG